MRYYRRIGATGRAGATLKINLPYELVEKLHLQKGDSIEMVQHFDGILLTKVLLKERGSTNGKNTTMG